MVGSSPTIGYGTGVPYCATMTHEMAMTFEWAVQLKEYHEKLLVEIYRSPLLSLPRSRSIPYLCGTTPLPPLRSSQVSS